MGGDCRPRALDAALERALDASGAVVIEGARATGKTMTALNAASSHVFVDDPATNALLTVAPRVPLGGSPITHLPLRSRR